MKIIDEVQIQPTKTKEYINLYEGESKDKTSDYITSLIVFTKYSIEFLDLFTTESGAIRWAEAFTSFSHTGTCLPPRVHNGQLCYPVKVTKNKLDTAND